jgi:hypothetical protein
MTKKKSFNEDEDDFDEIDNLSDDILEDNSEESESSDDFIPEDDGLDNLDIVIEIDESDLDSNLPPTEEEDIILSKHKLQGKHALKYDSIFKGKKDEKLDEMENQSYYNDNFNVDSGSTLYLESYDSEQYVKLKRVKEKVYQVLVDHTNLNFMNNRRKPSKVDFNQYFHLLKIHLKDDGFSNVELFNELSFYFSDNLFNMFKLLDNKWRNLVLTELRDHIGKTTSSKEITNRNIYLGTEVEFLHKDPITEDDKHYTGVVVETDYDESIFKIDSYENVYEVHISLITKILNNTKFKHNLNKLDNIDFL